MRLPLGQRLAKDVAAELGRRPGELAVGLAEDRRFASRSFFVEEFQDDLQARHDAERGRQERTPAVLERLQFDGAVGGGQIEPIHRMRLLQADHAAGQRPRERHEWALERLAGGVVGPENLFRPAVGVVAVDQQNAGPGARAALQVAEKAANGGRQGHWIVESGSSLDERQHLFHRAAERGQPLVDALLAARGANAVELPANGAEKGGAVEIVVLVQVVANAHAHGHQRRRLVGEAGHHDGDDVGVEDREVFEELQAIVARAEVPVEDGQIDGVTIRQGQRRGGVGGVQDAAIQVGPVKPFAERPANRVPRRPRSGWFRERRCLAPCRVPLALPSALHLNTRSGRRLRLPLWMQPRRSAGR